MDVQGNKLSDAMVLPRRPKLTIEQQVEHLKNKGVAFTLCTEEQAASFFGVQYFLFQGQGI